MKITKSAIIKSLLGVALLGALAGCAGYVGESGGVYAEPAGTPDNYVYYPDYQVYYNTSRRQYVYQDGASWVTRPAPKGISADSLSASRSVKVDFHDHPSSHHEAVVKQYPKHETPPAHANNEHGNDRN